MEYVVDSLFGLVMVAVSSYLVFSINKRALDKAASAIQIAEDEALKNRELSQTLEIKVQERTEELKQVVDKLERINMQLIEAHDELWGEMQLAKKIQTVLLPSQPMMIDYEITAYMNPADEVGGDYYDIIHSGGYDWMVIGDVSGHGVPAGLVMVMVQTAIHQSLSMHPDCKPSELLVAVNKVISENIRKMREDKYMTITVLACYKNGRFQFSGLHQDIMIYRALERRVERGKTNGMWIGLMEDIGGMICDEQFIMADGDTMLLYTDGLTEARLKGKNDAFGDDRLEALFLDHGDRSTETIKKALLKELNMYACLDDVTFLLIKKQGQAIDALY